MSETRIRLDKQIQKAQSALMVPISDANGELQYTNLSAVVKANETLTHLNSVEIIGGNLIIKYTAENGLQQVVSTALNLPSIDISISNAVLEHPQTGIYQLHISQNDGTSFTVDLSDLVAMVSQNTSDINFTGNGTSANPLKASISQTFKDAIPKNLDAFTDCTINSQNLDAAHQTTGLTVLYFDYNDNQWKPKNIKTLNELNEFTEVFNNLVDDSRITLQRNFTEINVHTIKVYRNGLRQDLEEDYSINNQGNFISFTQPFTPNYAEKVIVDYRLI